LRKTLQGMSTVLAKPKFREPCNGCGLCCALQLCEIAEEQFVGASAPCPALEWEDGRAWCGLVRHPSRHLKINFVGADPTVSPLFAKVIAVGQGCGMPDE
jgi:hypothetical protein